MPVLSGFGVNYTALQANWSSDQAYFKSIGLKNVRLHMPGLPVPWSVGNSPVISGGSFANVFTFWLQAMQSWHNAGFWVTGGPSGPQSLPVTNGTWQAYHDAVVGLAQYMVSNGVVVDELEVGNELEGHLTSTITSLTQSSGTATAVTSSAHNFQTGESVTIYGTNPSGYSGTFTVTVVNSTTFTYAVNSGLASPATSIGTTGTGSAIYGYCYSLTIPQLNVNIRQLATDVKAVSGWSGLGVKLGYGCFNNQINSGTAAYADWEANGLGGLDTISIHPYGQVNVSANTCSANGFSSVAGMISTFGSQCYVSEFHVDANASKDLEAYSPYEQAAQISTFLETYVLSSVSKFLVYSYVGYLNGDNQFAMKNTDGTFNPIWWQFFQ